MPPVIAVVDDDPLVHKLMTMLLAHKGYEVIHWTEAATACEMIQQRQPNLVILDLYMQGDPNAGLKVLECLHAHPTTSTVPVIIVSGTADTLRGDDTRISALAYTRLLKPVPFMTLLNHIAAALQQASSSAEDTPPS